MALSIRRYYRYKWYEAVNNDTHLDGVNENYSSEGSHEGIKHGRGFKLRLWCIVWQSFHLSSCYVQITIIIYATYKTVIKAKWYIQYFMEIIIWVYFVINIFIGSCMYTYRCSIMTTTSPDVKWRWGPRLWPS